MARVVYLDDDEGAADQPRANPVALQGSPDALVQQRASELASDPVDARALGRALAGQGRAVRPADRMLAGDFPEWARPRVAAHRADASSAKPDAWTTVVGNSRQMAFGAFRRALSEAEPVLASDDPEEEEEGRLVLPRPATTTAASRWPGEAVEVRLSDGVEARLVPGVDRAAVESVEFDLAAAPRPPPKRAGAALKPASLASALPARADVLKAAAAEAAAGGLAAAEALLEQNGIEPDAAEFKALVAKVGRQTGPEPELEPHVTCARGGLREPASLPMPSGLPEGKGEAAGPLRPEPSGRLELEAASIAEHPMVALKAYREYVRTAATSASAKGAASAASASAAEVRTPVAFPLPPLVPLPFERTPDPHQAEYAGVDVDPESLFDPAPDFLVAPPDRRDQAQQADAQLEREYREMSNDRTGARWQRHEAALREGVRVLKGGLGPRDVLEAAIMAEAVLAVKASRYLRAHPDTPVAVISAIKDKQVERHALAALAAVAEASGAAPGAAARLAPLLPAEADLPKVFVETLDALPALRARLVARGSEGSGKKKAAGRRPASTAAVAEEASAPSAPSAPQAKLTLRVQRALPLVRWEGRWAAGGRGRQPAVPRLAAERQAATTPLPDAPGATLPGRALPMPSAFPQATRALLAARGLGAQVADLENTDPVVLDGFTRLALPRMMAQADPALRAILLEDSRLSPPFPARFDPREARAWSTFAFARALTLPALAVQGGATTLKALRVAFLRGSLKPLVGRKDVAALVDTTEGMDDVPLQAATIKATDYARFEEETLVPWVRALLRYNAVAAPIDQLRQDLAELRHAEREQRASLLESLDADRLQAVMGLRRAGAWTDADYDRLAAEADAEAAKWEAGSGNESEHGAHSGSDSEGEDGEDGYDSDVGHIGHDSDTED